MLSLLNITVEHALNTTGIVASMVQNQNDADDANISTRAVAMFRNLPLLPNMVPKHSSIELSLHPQVPVERVSAELSPLYSAFWWEASALRSCGARFKTIQNGKVDKYMMVLWVDLGVGGQLLLCTSIENILRWRNPWQLFQYVLPTSRWKCHAFLRSFFVVHTPKASLRKAEVRLACFPRSWDDTTLVESFAHDVLDQLPQGFGMPRCK